MRRAVAVVFLGASLLSSQPAVRAQSAKTYRARLSPVPVVAYTATVTGSSAVGIDFNPNYAPAPPAARLIN